MSQSIQDFGIEKSLSNLGISAENKGVSSGGNTLPMEIYSKVIHQQMEN